MRISEACGGVAATVLVALVTITCWSADAAADGFEQGAPCHYSGSGAITPPPVHFTTVPGRPYTPPVHEFTDTEKEPAGNFAVTANWGDGTTSPATVNGEGCYEVSAPAHTYLVPGTYQFSETVDDAHTGLEHTVGSEQFYVLSALPSPALLPSPPPLRMTAGVPWSGTLGEFKMNLANQEPLSAYTASIDWGDGQSSSATIASPSYGAFTVDGSHTYSHALNAAIKVSVSAGIEQGTWIVANVLVAPSATQTAGSLKLARESLLAAVSSRTGTIAYELIFRLSGQLPRASTGRIDASLKAFGRRSTSIMAFDPHKAHTCYAVGIHTPAKPAPKPGERYPFSLSIQSPTPTTLNGKALERRYVNLAGMLTGARRRLGC